MWRYSSLININPFAMQETRSKENETAAAAATKE